jgi:hypothetical protein
LSIQGAALRAEIHSFPALYRKNIAAGQTNTGCPGYLFSGWGDAEILCLCRLAKFARIQKALIPLHFGNPELHNKLLAFRHPNIG